MEKSNYFTDNVLGTWDKRIYMRSIPCKIDHRQLVKPLPCGDGVIPTSFVWNGASSGVLRFAGFLAFPKWKHPIATCRHDWRCEHAKNKEQRKFADRQFKQDVAHGGTKWEVMKGYWGVRLGALFGVGSNY